MKIKIIILTIIIVVVGGLLFWINREISNHQTPPDNGENIRHFLYSFVDQISPLGDTEVISNYFRNLGIDLKPLGRSNEFFDMFGWSGSGPITKVELRINKIKSAGKLLILDIDPATNISMTEIQAKYPNLKFNVANEPANPTRITLVDESNSWGKLSFGFDQNNILDTIVFDSTDTTDGQDRS